MVKAMPQVKNDTVQLAFEMRDLKTKMPLNSVTCRVSTSLGKFYKYAISDKRGWIDILVNSNDSIEFVFIGYKNVKAKTNQYEVKKRNVIFMKPDAVNLKEVYVKAPAIRSKGGYFGISCKVFYQGRRSTSR